MSIKVGQLKQRVVDAAACVLAVKGYVSPIELLKQMRLLPETDVRLWEKGVYDCLQPHVQGSQKKLAITFDTFTEWVKEGKCVPVTASMRGSGRDQSYELRVTADADPDMERFFRTCYAPADITPRRLAALKKKLNKVPDLVVFMMVRDSAACEECGEEMTRGDFLFREGKKCLCLRCADLDHLEFLPSGDAAMSRRSKKHSPLSAVVVQFNRRRKRYERRGVLVTAKAIAQAEAECLTDADRRAAQRARGAVQREREDEKLVAEMSETILEQYPGCPAGEAREIASHTARRGRGRVGRSAAGRELQTEAVRLAVVAHIRHAHTPYDELLMRGVERDAARRSIASEIKGVVATWRAGPDLC
ncbi:MAG: DUF2293 domain-containing protein [Verrucomicrobia bacterium]|jgi:hypothetical protein|nr:DUF2293 domain-containing protein [Verrucomicrobiota bacterium]